MGQRVLLIYPPTFDSQWGAIRPPIGLGYLSEMLQQHGIEHQILDMSLGYPLKQVLSRIKIFGPDFIGVSMTSLFHQAVYAIMQTIKQHFPNIPIIAGGPHISTMREQVLKECEAIDYGATLEGDESIMELCLGKPPEQIKGMLYRTASHEITYTGDRAFIPDLDRLPFPRYGQFELDRYVAREIGIVTSRGCPYSCTFCPVKTTIGRTTRFRSAEHVVEELAYWHQKGYRDILILDDNFAMKPERVYAICDAIEQRGLQGFRFRCGNGIRADHVNYEMLNRMYAVGFRFVSFGVESANEPILQTIKKGEHLEQIEQAIKDACAIGYDVTLFFILGLPGETPQDAENSLRFAQKYPVFDAKFYNLIPFPNTEIYDWLAARQYFLASPEEYLNNASHWDAIPLFETPEFPRKARIQILHKAHRVRRQIRKAAMHRKLKRFGSAGAFAASLFVNDWLQDRLVHNKLIRRTAETTFRYLMK